MSMWDQPQSMVRDDQLDPVQTASAQGAQGAQEVGPKLPGRCVAHGAAENPTADIGANSRSLDLSCANEEH